MPRRGASEVFKQDSDFNAAIAQMDNHKTIYVLFIHSSSSNSFKIFANNVIFCKLAVFNKHIPHQIIFDPGPIKSKPRFAFFALKLSQQIGGMDIFQVDAHLIVSETVQLRW